MEREIRRNQSILRISAVATIIFGLWSIVKWSIYCILDPTIITEMIDQFTDPAKGKIVVWIVIIVVIIIDTLIRLYIAKGALDTARGKKRSMAYIIVAILLFVFTAYTTVSEFFKGEWADQWQRIILSLIVDITSIFVGAELVVAALKIRSIERKESK